MTVLDPDAAREVRIYTGVGEPVDPPEDRAYTAALEAERLTLVDTFSDGSAICSTDDGAEYAVSLEAFRASPAAS
jgi:hypothetical protein